MPATGPHPSTGQPPVFWLALPAVLVAPVVLVYLLAGVEGAIAVAIGLGAVALITGAIVGGLALRISGRMRSAREALPGSLLIPVVVGGALATATERIAEGSGRPSLRLKESTYSTFAVNGGGLHFVRGARGPWGAILPAEVRVVGFARTIVGTRAMDAIVLRVSLSSGVVDVPLVPMRLRGNPVRVLRTAELAEVAARIEAALGGEPVQGGWGY